MLKREQKMQLNKQKDKVTEKCQNLQVLMHGATKNTSAQTEVFWNAAKIVLIR